MKKIDNEFLKTQSLIIKSGVDQYLNGITLACRKNDGSIDKEEQKFINAITKDFDNIKKTLDKYID